MRGLTRQTDEVLDMLHEAGYKAYIVGGCVRDMLMGKEPEDYDITTSARPEEIKKVFSGKKRKTDFHVMRMHMIGMMRI